MSVVDADAINDDTQVMWPVALTSTELLYIACKADRAPAVLPRPSLSKCALSPDLQF